MKVLIKVPEDADRTEALKIYDMIDKMGHNVTILFQGTEQDMDFSNNGYLPNKEEVDEDDGE